MDSLFCDEVWLTTSLAAHDHDHDHACSSRQSLTKEECEEAVSICLEKETSYMPQPGYAHFLASSDLPRSQAVEWLVKCGSRLNLSPETVFNAVNYLDRFLSNNQCHGFAYSTVQLVSVACLSIAAKFMDTWCPCVDEIQKEGMDQVFDSATVERVELRVLQELGWRLRSTTAYSYVELVLACHDHSDFNLTSKLTNLLFTLVLDPRLVECRPCVVAASLLKWTAAADSFALMTTLLPQDLKEDLIKCDVIMKGVLSEGRCNIGCGEHECWSPVTVLSRVDMIYDDCVDDDQIYIPKTPLAEKKRKRKRGKEQP